MPFGDHTNRNTRNLRFYSLFVRQLVYFLVKKDCLARERNKTRGLRLSFGHDALLAL